MEERRLREASPGAARRAIWTDDDDVEPFTDAEAIADPSAGRPRVRPTEGRSHAERRQRHALSVRIVQRLQSAAGARKNHGAANRDQLGRRPGESAGVGNHGTGNQAREAWAVRADPDQR